MSPSTPSKTALVIRQIPFQGPGLLLRPVIEAGFSVRYCDAPIDDLGTLDPLEADLMIVMGGPFGVDDGAKRTFIASELRVLRERLREKRPTFGVCLGAQLIAKALGCRVHPSGQLEIGWDKVALSEEGLQSPLRHLAGLQMLHWHGDTFETPAEGRRLAATDSCYNQAFAVGHHIMAVQFHVEVDPALGIVDWIEAHQEEIRSHSIDVASLTIATEAAAQTGRAQVSTMMSEWLQSAFADLRVVGCRD